LLYTYFTSAFLILHMSNLDKSAERTLNRKNRNTGKIGNTGNRDKHRNTQQQRRLMLFDKVPRSRSACELSAVYCHDLTKIAKSTSNLSKSSISKFTKICWERTNLFHAERRLNRHDEANSCYLPCQAPQIKFPRIRSKLNSEKVCYQ
jgi:hypothetical protein